MQLDHNHYGNAMNYPIDTRHLPDMTAGVSSLTVLGTTVVVGYAEGEHNCGGNGDRYTVSVSTEAAGQPMTVNGHRTNRLEIAFDSLTQADEFFSVMEGLLDRRNESVAQRDRARDAVALAVAPNNHCHRQCCPVCGDSHRDADSPLWVLAYPTLDAAASRGDDLGAVCHTCANEHAPDDLASMARAICTLWHRGVDPTLLEALDAHALRLAPVKLSPRRAAPLDADGIPLAF